VLFNVRAIWIGLVVARPIHKEMIDRADHDANEWRAEGRIKDQAILVELEAIKKTTEETGQTVHKFISDMQKVTEAAPPGES